MKRILMALVCAVVLMATSAQAANVKLYFSGSAGFLISNDMVLPGIDISSSPGWSATGAVGFDFGELRVEGEIGYHTADIDTANGFSIPDADLSALSYMVNGFFDYDFGNSFAPYVGFGLGVADSDLNLAGTSRGSKTTLAYQFMLGFGYEIISNVFLTGGYRYFIISDEEAPDFHEFNLGARLMF